MSDAEALPQQPQDDDQDGAASEVEEGAPALDDSQSPTTYEEKIELEFLPPVNILQLLEIDKYLEGLPEVEATEIIPITDKPVIMVFLRESIRLTDVLSALPEVSEAHEDTDGVVSDLSDTAQGNGRAKKIQVTLSGNHAMEQAQG
jgi:hypothetical protein